MAQLTDWEALKAVFGKFELSGELWLCRGAIRCELLGELQVWDDFDVMAEESDAVLRSAIERSETEFSRTFHGGHSFRLPGGRKVDLWSMSSTRGRQCTSLAEALSTFEFNVDAIARSLRSGEIIDPLGMQNQILRRQLRIQHATDARDNAYVPWKAAYLVVRHRFVPDASANRLWERTPSVVGLPDRAIPALREELRQLNASQQKEDLRKAARDYPGLSLYVDALMAG